MFLEDVVEPVEGGAEAVAAEEVVAEEVVAEEVESAPVVQE